MIRKIRVYSNGFPAGELEETEKGKEYIFRYFPDYKGDAISLTMPLEKKVFEFTSPPPFFESLLPEGIRMQQLLKIKETDPDDVVSLLINSGNNIKGTIEFKKIK